MSLLLAALAILAADAGIVLAFRALARRNHGR